MGKNERTEMTAETDDKRLEGMIEAFLKQKGAPEELHACPRCGGKLHIQASVYARRQKKMLGASAWCDDCGIAITIDYAESRIPVWLKSKD